MSENLPEKQWEQDLQSLVFSMCQLFRDFYYEQHPCGTLVFCRGTKTGTEQKHFLAVLPSTLLPFLIKTFYLIVSKKQLPKQR